MTFKTCVFVTFSIVYEIFKNIQTCIFNQVQLVSSCVQLQ